MALPVLTQLGFLSSSSSGSSFGVALSTAIPASASTLLLFFDCGGDSVSITSVTDTAGNVWTVDSIGSTAGTGNTCALASAPITAGVGTTPTVTVNLNMSVSFPEIYVSSTPGLLTSNFRDVTGISSNGSGSAPTVNITTQNQSDFVFAGCVAGHSCTTAPPGATWNQTVVTGHGAGYSTDVTTSAQSIFATFTLTQSSGWQTVVAAYKQAVGQNIGTSTSESTGSMSASLSTQTTSGANLGTSMSDSKGSLMGINASTPVALLLQSFPAPNPPQNFPFLAGAPWSVLLHGSEMFP